MQTQLESKNTVQVFNTQTDVKDQTKNMIDISHVSYSKRAGDQKSYGSTSKVASISKGQLEGIRAHLIAEHLHVLQEAFFNPIQKNKLKSIVTQYITSNNIIIKGLSVEEIQDQIADAVAGMGVIQKLVEDVDITEIMVNGKDEIIIEKAGKEQKTELKFESDETLREVAMKIVNASGQTLTAAKPYANCRFPSMRINIVDHHISGLGIVMTIRKFAPVLRIDEESMIKTKQANMDMIHLMQAAIQGKRNILVVGPTGSGKTEIVKWLSGFIDERTITLEDTAELFLKQLYPTKHIVPMECRFTDEDETTVDYPILLKNALRQNPTRLIVGECRGSEAFQMLEILSTGHPGMTTIHANNARDAIDRLIMMCLQAGVKLDREIIGKWATKIFDFVIYQKKMDDGTRRIVQMIELLDYVNDDVIYNPLFEFKATSIEKENGKISKIDGYHVRKGTLSKRMVDDLLQAGVETEKIIPLMDECTKEELL